MPLKPGHVTHAKLILKQAPKILEGFQVPDGYSTLDLSSLELKPPAGYNTFYTLKVPDSPNTLMETTVHIGPKELRKKCFYLGHSFEWTIFKWVGASYLIPIKKNEAK